MNFFYGVNNNLLKSEIQIPIFQNRNLRKSNYKLFKTYPENKKWILKEITSKKINDYFYILHNDDISNNEIFFLAEENIVSIFD